MRDDFLIVLDWQPDVLLAGAGVGEVIQRPSVASYMKSSPFPSYFG